MSLFVSTMRSFEYDARAKWKKWEEKAEVTENRILLKVDRHVSLVDTSPRN